ncbi:TPA: HIRAN domain-containing protein [Streptococcus suis]|nr:HIRAN domain-containing protein [Streptococcus suis]HEM6308590.1 HIRAN domain-containing protein [Streptococcus suis]HEM6320567.1 HIRAN domain-containing protein [Streptococcus suis]
MNELTNANQQSILKVKLDGQNGLGNLKPFQRDIFLFDTLVAGTSHVEGIEELEPFIQVDDRLEFFRDIHNLFDKNAIEIRNMDGIKIGFVPQKDNVIFSRLMDAGKLLYGKVTNKELQGNWVKIYIGIYLQDL